MLTKLSAAQINQYMLDAADTIENLSGENEQLRAELARRDRETYAEKIASEAAGRGLISQSKARDYASQLARGDKDLSVVEEFVGHASPNAPFGEPLEKAASEDGNYGGSAEERFNDALAGLV